MMMRMLIAYMAMTTAVAAQSLASPPMPPGGTNYVYIDQIGNGNQIYILQQDSEAKQAAVLLKGDGNDITITQQGSGDHTAIIAPGSSGAMAATNDSNTFSITQQGDGTHHATIQLNDSTANGNNTASITQSGGAGADKSFTLQLSGSHIGATVVQDNPTVADSGSMSIQCYTGSCTGYSYTRH
jgi:Curlin associated repeat